MCFEIFCGRSFILGYSSSAVDVCSEGGCILGYESTVDARSNNGDFLVYASTVDGLPAGKLLSCIELILLTRAELIMRFASDILSDRRCSFGNESVMPLLSDIGDTGTLMADES